MRRMFPIQDGPSVPWEVMAPHESQCQKNHGQSIDRIAERGGFGCSEAWCVINGVDWFDMEKTIGHEEAKRRWIAYAGRINTGMVDASELEATIEYLRGIKIQTSHGGPWISEPNCVTEAERLESLVKKVEGDVSYQSLHERHAKLEAESAQMRRVLQFWIDYFQANIPRNADEQEAQGEQFTTAWFETERALAATAGQSLFDELERLRAGSGALCESIPFPDLKATGAEAMAWHARQGEVNCGLSKDALALCLDDIASQLKAFSKAREALQQKG